MEFITLKIIEYERLIVQLPIPKMGSGKKRKFPQKVIVGLGVCSKGVISAFSDFREWDNGPRSIHQRGASSCCQVC